MHLISLFSGEFCISPALEAIKTQIEADRDVCNLFLEQLNTKLGSLFSDSDEDSSSDLSDYSDDPPIIWHQEEKEEEDKEEEDKEEEEKEDKEEDENEKTIKPPNSQLEIIDCPTLRKTLTNSTNQYSKSGTTSTNVSRHSNSSIINQ